MAEFIIEYHYPPTSDHSMVWSAMRLGYAGHIGYGPTEEAAIANLRKQEELT